MKKKIAVNKVKLDHNRYEMWTLKNVICKLKGRGVNLIVDHYEDCDVSCIKFLCKLDGDDLCIKVYDNNSIQMYINDTCVIDVKKTSNDECNMICNDLNDYKKNRSHVILQNLLKE